MNGVPTAHPLTPEQPVELDPRVVAALRRVSIDRRGMSLVEVMVVIAIIVTLMSIVGYGVMSTFESSRVDTTKLQMHEINKKIELYSLKKKLPSTGEGIKAVYGDESVPLDSWGNEFVYISPGPDGLKYDIISYGADGAEGGTGNDADIRWSAER